MTLANPAVVTVNAVAYDLPRINMDNFGSEYLYSGTTFELRLKIRNSKEGVKAGVTQVDRHNVELTQTVYPTTDTPQIVRQAYMVIRNGFSDDKALVQDVGEALVDFMTDAHLLDVITWQS